MSQRQIDLLCQVLSMDNRSNHCYLEMISHLFGEGYMIKVRDENDINVAASRGEIVETKVEYEQQELTPELKAQIELRLMQVEATVNQMARGSAMLKDQQVFNVLKECEIQYSTKDLEAIEQFLRQFKTRDTNQVNFRSFLDYFRVSRDTSELLNHIQSQLKKSNANLDDVTVQRRLDLAEFKGVLFRAGVKISEQ